MFEIAATFGKPILGCALGLAMFGVLDGTNAATFEVLYTFQGGNDGGVPRGGMIADKAGNLYGTTAGGSSGQGGTVFKLAPDGSETVLHAFAGPDGLGPDAGLIADNAGNLYGTTVSGGGRGFGTVFELAPDGNEILRYDFNGGSDGALPYAGVILENGYLYGTTLQGGGTGCAQQLGCGTVFRLTRRDTETVLHAFVGHHRDGLYPYAGLVADKAGNLYGTTAEGGTACSLPAHCGSAFKVAPDGTETLLHTFHRSNSNGSDPYANLILDSAGDLYGTTTVGGMYTAGTVFKLAPDGRVTVLYNFCSQAKCDDGSMPYSGVIADEAGNLYGTATLGGPGTACGGGGCGTVFKLAPDGTYTVLYTFTGGSDGSTPQAGLLLRKGYLYGTTPAGGASNGNCETGCGTVFRVKP